MSRRKHSKIDRLDPAFKSEVEEMLISGFTYREVAEYIAENAGIAISIQAVCTHANKLKASIDSMRVAQENLKAIMHEMQKYPDLDASDAMLNLMSYQLFNYVQNLDEEDLQAADPVKLMKQAADLIKIAAYKRNLDAKSRGIEETGFDAVKTAVFNGLSKDNPKLYSELIKYLSEKQAELEAGKNE